MKALLFSLTIAIVVPSISRAQTEKGRWTVGTQLGNVSYRNQNGARSWSASVTPSAGYFIANGLVAGTGIPLSKLSNKSTEVNATNAYDTKTSTIGLSPFVRYFVGQAKLKPYLGVAYSYSQTKTENTQNYLSGPSTSESKGKNTALVPSLGIAYFVNRNVGLVVGLNYNFLHQDQTTTTSVPGYSPTTSTYVMDSQSVSLSAGFQLFFGQ